MNRCHSMGLKVLCFDNDSQVFIPEGLAVVNVVKFDTMGSGGKCSSGWAGGLVGSLASIPKHATISVTCQELYFPVSE